MLTFLQFLFETTSYTPDSTDSTERKGWMSPKGEPHYFNADDHHAFNPHPKIKKHIDRITHNASTKCKDRSPEGRSAIRTSLEHGYARYGKKFGMHFVHYDNKAPGATHAALKALRDLHPTNGDHIVVTHRPWDRTKANNAYDSTFDSPGKAAEHIRHMDARKPVSEALHEPDTRMNNTFRDHGFKYTGTKNGKKHYEHPNGDTIKHKFPTPNGNHSYEHTTKESGHKYKVANTGDTEIQTHLKGKNYDSIETGEHGMKGAKYSEDYHGSHHGQHDITLYAQHPSQKTHPGHDHPFPHAVGTLEYSEYKGKPHVSMVRTHPDFQRKGVASGLFHQLHKKYGFHNIEPGYSTPDGTALMKKLNAKYKKKK